MHRFWEIEEMVRLLASDLEKRCEAPSSAIALACCSKRLSGIVLDSLWEVLPDGLRSLMECLPPETWEIRNDEFVFLRCPSTEEWVRFSSYARRVRTFHAYDGISGSPSISSAAYHLLSMQTPILGPYLLPNLRSIHWELYSWDLVPFLRLFLNPELVDVDIEFPDDGPSTYLPAAISLIPTGDLTHLRLLFMGNDPLPMDALHNLLDKASETLRSVDLCCELSIVVIEKLLQLPNLRLLDVYTPETRISPPAVVFPSLEKLFINCGGASSWLHILRNIPNPALRELEVTFRSSSPTHLQVLGSSLLDANIEQTLTSLACTCHDTPLTEAGLRPFLSFRKLTKLELSNSCTRERCGNQLNDLIICKLAMALPQLTYLSLGGTPCVASTSAVTITSLVALSTNCVDLDFLRLHFDANDIISRDTHANSQTYKFACKLRHLDVGSQPLPSNHDDVLLVAFAILYIFPHLEIVSTITRSWIHVRRVVELFQRAPKTVPLPTTN